MSSEWHGILKIEHIEHIRNGAVIWQEKNIRNMLHTAGEAFLLTACFANDGTTIPANYYFGLDARAAISIGDDINSIYDEPLSGGYARVAVNSTSAFTIQDVDGIYRAVSPVVTFVGSGSGFGPVKNFFMTTTSNNTGILISSASLSSSVTLAAGDNLNLKMSLQLHDCP